MKTISSYFILYLQVSTLPALLPNMDIPNLSTTLLTMDQTYSSESDGLSGERVELYETSRERQKYDDQANLYSIILSCEHLERSYARDAVDDTEYTTQCNKLISQFRLAEKAVCGTDMTTE